MNKLAKRVYKAPALMSGNGLVDEGDVVIVHGPSQGTTGEDPIYTWDPAIDPNDIDMFWLSYDDTDLAGMDSDGNLFISKAEFDAWYNAEQPW